MQDFVRKISHLPANKLALLAAQLKDQLERKEEVQREPIAVIGLGCRFPEAEGPEAFWRLLDAGVDATREVPSERWDVDAHYDADPDCRGKMYTKRGGFLADVAGFDAGYFGISPREAAAMDPQQRILLEVAWQALEDAGQLPASLKGTRTSVHVGIGAGDYAQLQLRGSDPTAIDVHTGTGNAASVAVGRVAYLLGAHGPTMAVDTACSSSLVAVDLACKSLRSGESDLALAGGVHLVLTPEVNVFLSRARALSPDGRCKTFAAAADGYGRGEGCGVVVLKRLCDAERDGERVLALIEATAVNHDGRSSGLTVPSGLAQQALLRECLRRANRRAEDVSYVEAHGTGTPLGDPIELEALSAAYGGERTDAERLRVGSVKTNIGHLEAAAGIAGLIKVVLALQHQRLPAHLHASEPTPNFDWKQGRLRIAREAEAWPVGERERVAGVSSFGLSGTNAHVLLRDAPVREASADLTVADGSSPTSVLLTVSGDTTAARRDAAAQLARHLAEHPEQALADVAHTAACFRTHHGQRAACVVSSRQEAQHALEALASAALPAEGEPVQRTQVAFLFSGQGLQYPGMGKQLYEQHAVFRHTLDRCAAQLAPALALPLLEVMFGDHGDVLSQTAYAQPALFALEVSLCALWMSWGITPSALAGHSVGEYVAAYIAGVFSLEDALTLVATRGRLMQSLPAGGAMASLEVDAAELEAWLREIGGVAVVAAENAPRERVVSGELSAIERLLARAAEEGCVGKRLAVSHAFHSPLMEPILDAFEAEVSKVALSLPRLPVYSNLSARCVREELTQPSYYRRQLRSAVRFSASLAAMADDGVRVFLEVGPGAALARMGRLSVDRPGVRWLSSLRRGRSEHACLLHALGAAYESGAEPKWSAVGQGAKVALPTYPFQRSRHWVQSAPRRPSQRALALVHDTLESPWLPGCLYQTRIDAETLPLITDHRIYGEVVVPGALHVALLLTIAKQRGVPHPKLSELEFRRALVIPEAETKTVQTLVDAAGVVKIVALDGEAGDAMTSLANARLSTDAAAPTPLALQEVLERCAERHTARAFFYDAAWEQGLQLGSGFRWLTDIARRPGEALCTLRAAAVEDEHGHYVLHPGLIDSCFQSMVAVARNSTEPLQVCVPIGCDSIRLFDSPRRAEQLYCHTELLPAGGDGTVSGVVRLYGEDQRPIAEVIGLHLRAVQRAVLGEVEANRGLSYEVAYAPIAIAAARAPGRSWLLITECTSRVSALGAALLRRGDRVRVATLHADQPVAFAVHELAHGELTCALRELTGRECVDELVVLWGAPEAADTFSSARAELLTARTLEVIQVALAGEAPLSIVTTGSLPVGGLVSAAGAEQAGLWGLGRTLASESPRQLGRLIDLPARPTADDMEQLAAVLRETESEAKQVALRADQAYALRLRRATSRATAPIGIRADVSYLITGGTGALGLHVAADLVAHGARHLLLVARRAPSPDARAALLRLTDAGAQVELLHCDLAAAESRAALAFRLGEMPPLAGVVHAAGALADGALGNLNAAAVRRAFGAKVAGACCLDELVGSARLDFLVYFSSMASVLGAPGQGSYAAANAVLDALAQRAAAGGARVCSINWGPWEEGGMAASLRAVDQRRHEASGAKPLATALALRALHHTLASATPQRGLIDARFTQLTRVDRGLLVDLVCAPKGDARAAPRLCDELPALEVEQRSERVLELVRARVARVLQLSQRIPDRARLFEAGMDSLTALELKEALEHEIGHGLPSTLLFDAPNIAALSQQLCRELGVETARDEVVPARVKPRATAADELELLSEEQMERLLEAKLLGLTG